MHPCTNSSRSTIPLWSASISIKRLQASSVDIPNDSKKVPNLRNAVRRDHPSPSFENLCLLLKDKISHCARNLCWTGTADPLVIKKTGCFLQACQPTEPTRRNLQQWFGTVRTILLQLSLHSSVRAQCVQFVPAKALLLRQCIFQVIKGHTIDVVLINFLAQLLEKLHCYWYY